MYYPIFTANQYELSALKECIENDYISSSNIFPIVEPVRTSELFLSFLQLCKSKSFKIGIIKNSKIAASFFDKLYG